MVSKGMLVLISITKGSIVGTRFFFKTLTSWELSTTVSLTTN